MLIFFLLFFLFFLSLCVSSLASWSSLWRVGGDRSSADRYRRSLSGGWCGKSDQEIWVVLEKCIFVRRNSRYKSIIPHFVFISVSRGPVTKFPCWIWLLRVPNGDLWVNLDNNHWFVMIRHSNLTTTISKNTHKKINTKWYCLQFRISVVTVPKFISLFKYLFLNNGFSWHIEFNIISQLNISLLYHLPT